jgi:hypothetical protein
MHNARAQRRLARMTGRAESSVKVDQLTARSPSRIGHPAAGKHNNNKIAAVDSTADTSNGISQVDVKAAEEGTLTVANASQTANSLGLDIEDNDVAYIATIQMGTPPRDFKILMDSGSADFWVGAEGCQSETGGDCVSFTSDLFSPFINLLIITVL